MSFRSRAVFLRGICRNLHSRLITALRNISFLTDGCVLAVIIGGRDPTRVAGRESYLPGSLVLAPVRANGKIFYWPAIVDFSPDREAEYVRTDDKGKNVSPVNCEKSQTVALDIVHRGRFPTEIFVV